MKMKDIILGLFQGSINKLKKEFAESTLEGIYSTTLIIFEKAVELEVIRKTLHDLAICAIQKDNRGNRKRRKHTQLYGKRKSVLVLKNMFKIRVTIRF